MREIRIKPILFNADMVRAILEGRKTVTRRAIKPQFKELRHYDLYYGEESLCVETEEGRITYIPLPFLFDDVIWVRETWAERVTGQAGDLHRNYFYKADMLKDENLKWRPSIHMPKEAARIFLRVTEVFAERLQDISLSDIWAEGLKFAGEGTEWEVRKHFSELWNSTIKPADRDKYGWNANPFCWKIEFERCERPDGWNER